MAYEAERRLMVEEQLVRRGIRDDRVLEAMGSVPRHLFVSDELIESAYFDCALPIGEGQTISQPYMVAVMTELLELKGDERILEIGTGSGYQTAILSQLAAEVFTIERIPSLAEKAKQRLMDIGRGNVHAIVSDGTQGLPEHAPYDGIIVTAGAPEVPQSYLDQLRENGKIVIPVGSRYSQVLYQVVKTPEGVQRHMSTACVFVPLVGQEGWDEESG